MSLNKTSQSPGLLPMHLWMGNKATDKYNLDFFIIFYSLSWRHVYDLFYKSSRHTELQK